MERVLEHLVIIAWNIFIGNTPTKARKALKTMIRIHKPDVIALMEASNLYGELDELGYNVIQLKPRPLRKDNQPGQGNIAILVSPDYVVKEKKALHMLTFWLGPKHGWPQDPRVYRSVKIRHRDDPTARTWMICAAHTPFGMEARAESRVKLISWFRNCKVGRPAILVLDANMGINEFRQSIAKPASAEATGHGIDLEAHKNCELVDEEDLGKGISDHPAIKRKYAARRRSA